MSEIREIGDALHRIDAELQEIKEQVAEIDPSSAYRGSARRLIDEGYDLYTVNEIFNGSGNPFKRAYGLDHADALRILMDNISSTGDSTGGRQDAARRIGISRQELADFLGEDYDANPPPSAGQQAAWDREALRREEVARKNIINGTLEVAGGPLHRMGERFYEMMLTGMSPDQVADRYKLNADNVRTAIKAYSVALTADSVRDALDKIYEASR